LSRLNHAIEEIDKNLGGFKFHLAAEDIYSFVWNNYCDWYIELIKPRLYGKTGEESAEVARQTAFYVLHTMLGLLHPFMPFITEELHSILRKYESSAKSDTAGKIVKVSSKKKSSQSKIGSAEVDPEAMNITSAWPSAVTLSKKDLEAAKGFNLLQEVISSTRMIRAEAGIAPDKKAPIVVRSRSEALANLVKEKELAILRLAQAASITVNPEYTSGKFDSMEPFSEGEVFIPLEGVMDLEKERERLQTDRENLMSQIAVIEKKLSNENFVSRAPADVVEKEKARLQEMREKTAAIVIALKRFNV
jgi:valyl-tRNA synthetase